MRTRTAFLALAVVLAGCSARPGARQSFRAAALDAEWERYDQTTKSIARAFGTDAERLVLAMEPFRRAEWDKHRTGIEPDWGKVAAESVQISLRQMLEQSTSTPR